MTPDTAIALQKYLEEKSKLGRPAQATLFALPEKDGFELRFHSENEDGIYELFIIEIDAKAS